MLNFIMSSRDNMIGWASLIFQKIAEKTGQDEERGLVEESDFLPQLGLLSWHKNRVNVINCVE